MLMMSELATNAIVHAATGFEVGIDRSADWLRIAVTDVGGGQPELHAPSSSDPHGRGLQIVKELSDEWGMIDNENHSGKTVWCAVRLDRTGPSEGEPTSTGEDARGRTDRRRGRPVRRQQKRKSDRSEAVDDGRAQSSSKSGGHARSASPAVVTSGYRPAIAVASTLSPSSSYRCGPRSSADSRVAIRPGCASSRVRDTWSRRSSCHGAATIWTPTGRPVASSSVPALQAPTRAEHRPSWA